MKHLYLAALALTIISAGCHRDHQAIPDWESYTAEHEKWQENRLERLKSENGWLNLAGLYWLSEGKNSFGSDSSNTIIFPEKFPAFGGTIILEDSTARLVINPETPITTGGKPIDDTILSNDNQPNTTVLAHGSFRWFIIRRGAQFGIRLRDLEHPRTGALDHIPSYPFNKKFVVEARMVPFDTVRIVEVPTVIDGYTEQYQAPGELVFRINGKRQTLLPFSSGKGYFLIFGDETNGMDTYGAGRFLYTEMINGDRVIIDFNKATNPPCAFSPFATCPLPPPENLLEMEIRAGEKTVHP